MLLALAMLWLGALAATSALYVVVVLGQGAAAAVRRSPARPRVGAPPRATAFSGTAPPQRRSA